MDYNGWITAVCSELEYQLPITPSSATPTGVVAFDSLIPNAVDYTENRLQRDLDLLGTIATTSGTMTANQRLQTLPVPSGAFSGGIYVVAKQIRLVIGGVKQPPLEPVNRDFLDYVWPDDAPITDPSTGLVVNPKQWCPDDQATILVGPSPGSTLAFEAVGTARFKQLSASNLTNFLSANFPDLYLAASMVFWTGFQRDFGAQSDDPKMAQSWENQYQALLKSADVEEARKRFVDMVQSPSNPTNLAAE